MTQCKDLGVCHRNSRVTNNIVIERTKMCESICKNINTLPVKLEKNAYIASSIVLGGTLYGAEVDHLTKNNLHKISQVLGSAIWGNRGSRNKIAGLLLHKQGQIEHFVKRATQIAGH